MTREISMPHTTPSALIEYLTTQGHDLFQIRDFLEDGEMLEACGFTDADQELIEDTYHLINERIERRKQHAFNWMMKSVKVAIQ